MKYYGDTLGEVRRFIAAGFVLLTAAGALAAQSINAAGATFPSPIYQKWFADYHAAHPEVRINYQDIGSGGGIKQLKEGTIDFGASDMPMTDKQIASMKVKPLHFPTVLGAVVLTYNIPGAQGVLRLTPETLAGIYLGQIIKWNDPRVKSANPGFNLPDKDIIVVRRSDGSGTTFAFTQYLSKISPEWKSRVGSNTSVSWPIGLGQKGNDGIAGMVKQTPNSIGYVELLFAVNNKMRVAEVKNAAGNFVKASLQSVTAAANALASIPGDLRVSVANAGGAGSWPISTFTWLLIPSHFDNAGKRTAIVGFLQWMLTDGQKQASALHYAPLPQAVIEAGRKQIALIR